MPEERCDCCRYWKAMPDAQDDTGDPDDVIGRCRLNPPVNQPAVVYLIARDTLAEGKAFGRARDVSTVAFDESRDPAAWAFPVVFGCDWCGQFNPAPPPPAEDSE